jgi:hypothetical protein
MVDIIHYVMFTIYDVSVLGSTPDARCHYTKRNSVALDHKRTISTEQPPLIGEVSTNFCG